MKVNIFEILALLVVIPGIVFLCRLLWPPGEDIYQGARYDGMAAAGSALPWALGSEIVCAGLLALHWVLNYAQITTWFQITLFLVYGFVSSMILAVLVQRYRVISNLLWVNVVVDLFAAIIAVVIAVATTTVPD